MQLLELAINKCLVLSLELPEFPVFQNPLQPIMQDTPMGPTTLNMPNINAELVSSQVQRW